MADGSACFIFWDSGRVDLRAASRAEVEQRSHRLVAFLQSRGYGMNVGEEPPPLHIVGLNGRSRVASAVALLFCALDEPLATIAYVSRCRGREDDEFARALCGLVERGFGVVVVVAPESAPPPGLARTCSAVHAWEELRPSTLARDVLSGDAAAAAASALSGEILRREYSSARADDPSRRY